MQSTSPAHSASLTRLHLPALWSFSQHNAELTHAHQHLSCAGNYSTCGEWGVLSWWGTHTSPDLWIPRDLGVCQAPSQSLPSKNCMNCSALQIIFAKPGEEYMWKQEYMHFSVKCLWPVSKSQKLFNFWQTLLIKQNLWRKRSAVFYLGMDKQVLKCFYLRKDQVGNTAVCFWCKKPSSASFLSEILLQMWRASRLSLVHLRSHENQLIKKNKLLHDLLHI